MKFLMVIFLGLSVAILSEAQSGEPSKKGEPRDATRSSADVVPLPSIRTLTKAQAAGKKLFVQRCSVCHLPALPSYSAYGPVLDSAMVADRGDQAIRDRILHGSVKMPGFQYTLSAAEIDKIADYLKNLDLPKTE